MAQGPYSRLYHALMDEFPSVWESDSQLVTFVRMLVIADKYYPQHPPMPPRTPTVQALIRHSLVVPSEGQRSFTIRGLAAERERRSAPGRHAAQVRWQSERNAPADANAMPVEKRREEKETSIGANASNGAPQVFLSSPRGKALTETMDGLWHKGQHSDCQTCRNYEAAQR